MKTRSGREVRTPEYLKEYTRPTEAHVRVCDPEAFRGERHKTNPDTAWLTFGVVWADAKQMDGRITLGDTKMYFLTDVVDEVIRRGYMIKTSHMYKMLRFMRGAHCVTLNSLLEKMGTKTTYVMHNAESDVKAMRNTCEFMGVSFPQIRYKCTKRFIDDMYRDELVHDYEGENSVPFSDSRLESLYKWATNNPKFVQSHLGDEDVLMLYESLDKIASKYDVNILKRIVNYSPVCTSSA